MVIHSCHNIFHPCIPEYISYNRRDHHNNHRQRHIMAHQFASRITGRQQGSDYGRFLLDRTSRRNRKYKCQNNNYDIKQPLYHYLVSAHILSCEGDCLIILAGNKVCHDSFFLYDILDIICLILLFFVR